MMPEGVNSHAMSVEALAINTRKLIIFDCDGVLVDSEDISVGVLAEFLGDLGCAHSFDEARERYQGVASPLIFEDFSQRTGISVPADVEAQFRARQFQALEVVRPVPGAAELLRACPMPYCVASNGPHEKMDVTLAASGLMPLVAGRIFSRTDVPRPKPHPDLFLHAAATFGVPPGQCLVVEDSLLGIRAARAADMTAVGFCGTSETPPSDYLQAGASAVAQHLPELTAAMTSGASNTER